MSKKRKSLKKTKAPAEAVPQDVDALAEGSGPHEQVEANAQSLADAATVAFAGEASETDDVSIEAEPSAHQGVEADGLEAAMSGEVEVAISGDAEVAMSGEAEVAMSGEAEPMSGEADADGPESPEPDAAENVVAASEVVGDDEGDLDPAEGAPVALPISASTMEAAELKHLVEALVFASDKPVTLQRLRQLTRVSDVRRLEQALAEVANDYRDRGISLQAVSGGYQFRTHTKYSSWVQQLIAGRPVRLSRAQLETLSIIAYRQPITRPEIDDIRGVDSSGTLRVLIERSLIRILGKREEVGRPMLYGTTKEFLDFFSLTDLRELPTLREYSELTAESRKVMSDRLGVELESETPDMPEQDPADAPVQHASGEAEGSEDPLSEIDGEPNAEMRREPNAEMRGEHDEMRGEPNDEMRGYHADHVNGGELANHEMRGEHADRETGSEHADHEMPGEHADRNTGSEHADHEMRGEHADRGTGSAHADREMRGEHADRLTGSEHADLEMRGEHADRKTGSEHADHEMRGDHADHETDSEHADREMRGAHADHENGSELANHEMRDERADRETASVQANHEMHGEHAGREVRGEAAHRDDGGEHAEHEMRAAHVDHVPGEDADEATGRERADGEMAADRVHLNEAAEHVAADHRTQHGDAHLGTQGEHAGSHPEMRSERADLHELAGDLSEDLAVGAEASGEALEGSFARGSSTEAAVGSSASAEEADAEAGDESAEDSLEAAGSEPSAETSVMVEHASESEASTHDATDDVSDPSE
ncbi:MAG: chromosome segregation and condensation protein ScpB [Myxococcales bacterium]|nr:chromosome segregation and condensation protein ScpB [Myxococcales bacterium]